MEKRLSRDQLRELLEPAPGMPEDERRAVMLQWDMDNGLNDLENNAQLADQEFNPDHEEFVDPSNLPSGTAACVMNYVGEHHGDEDFSEGLPKQLESCGCSRELIDSIFSRIEGR